MCRAGKSNDVDAIMYLSSSTVYSNSLLNTLRRHLLQVAQRKQPLRISSECHNRCSSSTTNTLSVSLRQYISQYNLHATFEGD
jgi:hypothetical protein